MFEATKSLARRLRDPLFTTRVLRGDVLDVGGGYDGLDTWKQLLPLVTSVRNWDMADGDAQFLSGVEDHSFDCVHSSHSLEHMRDPFEAIRNWWRVLRPGGYLAITVPDEDMYEQGEWPPTFNRDHKWSFTIYKESSWSPNCVPIPLLMPHLKGGRWLRITHLDDGFRYGLPRQDQTQTILAECAIELVVWKCPPEYYPTEPPQAPPAEAA